MIKREIPGPGQESVWDYPRPPRLEDSSKHIQVHVSGICIADTKRAKRVLETSHPPVYYIPPDDIQMQYLERSPRQTMCEWKGLANYYTLALPELKIRNAGWYYPNPVPAFASLVNYVAFYPSLMDECLVDGERVVRQEGDFYGGWITSDVVGPFKGAPGTMFW